MSGYYRMYRGWMDHPSLRTPGTKTLVEPFCRRLAWAWLIENAAWQDTRIDVLGKTTPIRRGQLSVSYRRLAEVWGWGLKAVRVFINRLKTDTLLDTDQGTARTLITICNYERYQDPHNVTGTQMGTTRGTAGAQQGHSRGTQKKEGNTVKEVNTEEGIDIGLTPSLEAEPSSSVDASSADELLRTATVTQLKAPKDASLAVALWNAMAAECGISPVSIKIKPGSTRSVHLMARLREGGGIEGWKAALERVRESPFLLGQSEREWVVSFDWLIKPSNFVKVIEGVYRRVTPKPRAAPKSNAELLAERMGYGRPAQTASGPFDNPPTIDGEAINA